MDILKQLISNQALIVSLAAWLIAQIFKVFTNLFVEKTFDIKRLVGDGGMPSAHSATVMALAIMVGWTSGFDGVAFAVSLIFAVVVMRDAVGVRRETGKQAESIKDIAEALNQTFLGENSEIRTENLKILVGHTPLQVTFGAILGAAVSVIYILLFLV